MKFTTIAISAAVVLVSVSSRPLMRRDVDPNLVPQFGVTPGIHDTASASCLGIDGSNGQPILIPCQCPPDRDTFIDSLNANVAAGFVVHNPSVAVTFPQDNSTASQLARIDACLVTLQNLNGTGQGCPASSTTWIALQKSISEEGSSSPAPIASTAAATSAAVSTQAAVATSVAASSAPAASATGAATPSNVTLDESLVPQFGVQAGVNPSGTGNCDGIDGANGQPILIPCACPPDRTSFIDEMSANVAAGFVINNPTVKLTFPLDNSTSSQLARLNAAAVTLQNLNGPGQGCPVSSTTFSAQQKAIEAAASS